MFLGNSRTDLFLVMRHFVPPELKALGVGMSVTDMTVKNCISFSNQQNALNSATTIDIASSEADKGFNFYRDPFIVIRFCHLHFSLCRNEVNAPHNVDRRLFCTNDNPNLVSFSPLPVLRWEVCSTRVHSCLGSFWFANHVTFSIIGMWLNSKTESFFPKETRSLATGN